MALHGIAYLEEKVQRGYLRACAYAVIALVVTVFLGHLLLGILLSPYESSVNRMRLASQQSVVVQEIGRITTRLGAERRPGRIYTLRVDLNRAVQRFEALHRSLIEGDPDANISRRMSNTSRSLIFHPSGGLDRWARDIVAATNRDFLGEALTPVPDAAGALDRMIHTAYLPRLRDLIDQYAEDGWLTMRLVDVTRIGVLSLFFVSLAVVGSLIFRPLGKRTIALVRDFAKSEVLHDVRYDEVTGLPNRDYLRRFMSEHGDLNWTHDFRSAILHLDLKNFAPLKEEAGLAVANGVLRMAARRIEAVCRSGDFIARIGGDQFLIVTTLFREDHASVNRLTDALTTRLGIPFDINGASHVLGVNIGISFLDKTNKLVDQVLAQAEVALSDAKRTDDVDVQFYQPGMKSVVERRKKLKTDLQQAMVTGEVRPHFQPVVDTRTGDILGVETLVRWHHPEKGVLTPVHFIDVAESEDLATDLTKAVAGGAMRTLSSWDQQNLTVPFVGVILSARQILAPGAVDEMKWIVESYDVPPSRVAIEISESLLAQEQADNVIRAVGALTQHGFQLTIDDFGTTRVPTRTVASLNPKRVKIDRAFIANIDSDSDQQVHAAELIQKAHRHRLTVVAEGVETPGERGMLGRLGCDAIQGFLVAEPLQADEMTNWFVNNLGGMQRSA